MIKINNWNITVYPLLVNPCAPPEMIRKSLQGNVYGHPGFEDGKHIITSPIKSVDKRKITTENTIYVLGKIDPKYRKYLKKERPNWNWRKPITIKEK